MYKTNKSAVWHWTNPKVYKVVPAESLFLFSVDSTVEQNFTWRHLYIRLGLLLSLCLDYYGLA